MKSIKYNFGGYSIGITDGSDLYIYIYTAETASDGIIYIYQVS
jgi:hypothetical protein